MRTRCGSMVTTPRRVANHSRPSRAFQAPGVRERRAAISRRVSVVSKVVTATRWRLPWSTSSRSRWLTREMVRLVPNHR